MDQIKFVFCSYTTTEVAGESEIRDLGHGWAWSFYIEAALIGNATFDSLKQTSATQIRLVGITPSTRIANGNGPIKFSVELRKRPL